MAVAKKKAAPKKTTAKKKAAPKKTERPPKKKLTAAQKRLREGIENPWVKVGRPRNVEGPEEMQRIFEEYFGPGGDAWVEENEKLHFRPTISGLALACGTHRANFFRYQEKPEFRNIIKNAKTIIEKAHEAKLYTNNVAGSIFMLKANFGWNEDLNAKENNDKKNIQINFNVSDDGDAKITKGKKKKK